MSARGVLLAACCAAIFGLCAFAPGAFTHGALGAGSARPAAAGGAPNRPAVTWVRGNGSYTEAARGRKAIKLIVIHTTDGGSFTGNVWWLSGGHSHASAHYVVARDGQIAQLVHLSDIAWHAGNWRVNKESVGIEHVGDTYDPAGFTLEEYRSSAQLVAWLVRRFDIPIDREHIIGHSDVPDPNDPSQSGGSDHHTDPGPYWKWGLYLRLVRRYAFPLHLDVRSTTIYRGQTVAGVVPWRAATKGVKGSRVDFIVDGEVLWSDRRAPFAFAGGRGWNTTQLRNGRHVLVVRAAGGGKTASARYVVNVRNHEFVLTTSTQMRDWQKVRGVVKLGANVFGARTSGIVLAVDGRPKSRDRKAPFRLLWSSRSVKDGKHVLSLSARALDGRLAVRKVTVVVQNHPVVKPKPKPAPRPAPPPAPAVAWQSLGDGQTLQGPVAWQAQTTGAVARVDFVVDGVVRGSATAAPWAWTWDTAADAPGQHTAVARAVAADGRTAELKATVTVAAPPPP